MSPVFFGQNLCAAQQRGIPSLSDRRHAQEFRLSKPRRQVPPHDNLSHATQRLTRRAVFHLEATDAVKGIAQRLARRFLLAAEINGVGARQLPAAGWARIISATTSGRPNIAAE